MEQHRDSNGIGGSCSQCSCGEYGPSSFECGQCGKGFGEYEARQGHEYCESCSNQHGMCIMCGEPRSAGNRCGSCAAR